MADWNSSSKCKHWLNLDIDNLIGLIIDPSFTIRNLVEIRIDVKRKCSRAIMSLIFASILLLFYFIILNIYTILSYSRCILIYHFKISEIIKKNLYNNFPTCHSRLNKYVQIVYKE